MSDDEPYDADGDVSRFLQCHSPDAHLFSLSEPEGTLGGLFQYAPATEQAVHGHPAAPQTLNPAPDLGVQVPATEVQGQRPPDFGVQLPATEEIQGHPALHTQNVAPDFGLPGPKIYGQQYEAPIINGEHYEAPTIRAQHYEAPTIDYGAPIIDGNHYGARAMDVEPQFQAPAPDFGLPVPIIYGVAPIINPEQYEAPPINAEHYQAPTINAEHYQAPTINAEHYQAPTINAEHYQAPIINAEDHQLPGMDEVEQVMLMDLMLASEMQNGYGFPDPTLVQGGGIGAENYEALIIAEHHQVAVVNVEGHQVPVMDDVEPQYQEMAMDVQPAHILAPEMQPQAYGFPDPTLVQGDGANAEHFEVPIIAEHHHQAPVINSKGHQVSAMDVEPQQHQAMAMDVQPTHMLPTEMQQAHGFPDPTPPPPPVQGNGVDAASLLEGNNMLANGVNSIPPPTNLSLYDQLIKDGEYDLAAVLEMIKGTSGGNAGGAEAAADERDVYPTKEEVTFKPITFRQLDCSRCRSVREIVVRNGKQSEHVLTRGGLAYVNYYNAPAICVVQGRAGCISCLRGRRDEWVMNFIAKSAEKMSRNGGQLVHDMFPRPSNHPHMELEVGMLNNILYDAPAATADQAAPPDGTAQPAAITQQAQENTATPPVAEAAVTEAAVPEAPPPEATQPAVTPAQEKNTDAPSAAEAAAAPEATSSPKAAEPAATQAQENTDAPSAAEAAAPETASPKVDQPSVTPRAQENADAPPAADDEAAVPAEAAEPSTSREKHKNKTTDAAEKFGPFNWEGFKPEILESSLVKPYDPASGIDVLMYPSMQEQLVDDELKKKEAKKLSKMAVEDTPDYLNLNDDHYANAPDFASPAFRRLCDTDCTYRMYKKRVSGLDRKIKKLEERATRVGTGGLFTIKQKLQLSKREKEELYDVINKAVQENERSNNGAGPSNSAGPSSGAGPSNAAGTLNNGAGPSNVVAGTSNSGAGPSNVAGTTKNNDAAGPSNVAAGTSNNDASPSNVAAGTSSNNDAGPSNVAAAGTSNNDEGPSNAAVPSNVAGPSGTK
ncbi:hypothetical protein BAE44_0004399 [Dichanthelium oligosanthes]|uniref:Uncharacterized protein n=1 Tax=Dichanthelium oligosanthes TaxID=888268 RepID=A0A1E5WB08_9POAL|nr:hypothetical protein BAE44_0004399 [Dichanthelium oligosanthes]